MPSQESIAAAVRLPDRQTLDTRMLANQNGLTKLLKPLIAKSFKIIIHVVSR